MKSLVLALLCFSLAACVPAAHHSTASAPEAAHDGPRSPLQVRIEERAATETQAELTVVITRVDPEAPLFLAYQAPPGVEVVGLSRGLVGGDAAELEVPVSLTWTGPAPTEDLVVRLSTQRAGMGARASATYRFGRPERPVPHVGQRPVDVQVGGLRLDNLVDVDTTKQR